MAELAVMGLYRVCLNPRLGSFASFDVVISLGVECAECAHYLLDQNLVGSLKSVSQLPGIEPPSTQSDHVDNNIWVFRMTSLLKFPLHRIYLMSPLSLLLS